MKLIKKITTICTILATVLTGFLLIMLLFDVKLFGDSNLDFILTMATIGIGGFFAINSMNMVSKNKVIGIVSLALISASVFLILLSVWIAFNSKVYLRVTLSLGLLSILFNVIVSSGLSLGKAKIVWQVLVYIFVGITDLIATLAIFGVINIVDILPFFLMLVIMCFVGVVILKVLSKKVISDLVESNKDTVRISKSEYVMLVEKAKKYDELISNQ